MYKRQVPIGPGLTAFTLMPLPANSAEATLTTERKAALLALNKLLPPKPISFNQDVVMITDALSFKWAIDLCREKYDPLKLTSIMSSKKASSVSAIRKECSHRRKSSRGHKQ